MAFHLPAGYNSSFTPSPLSSKPSDSSPLPVPSDARTAPQRRTRELPAILGRDSPEKRLKIDSRLVMSYRLFRDISLTLFDNCLNSFSKWWMVAEFSDSLAWFSRVFSFIRSSFKIKSPEIDTKYKKLMKMIKIKLINKFLEYG
jgi:hypothetical protein